MRRDPGPPAGRDDRRERARAPSRPGVRARHARGRASCSPRSATTSRRRRRRCRGKDDARAVHRRLRAGGRARDRLRRAARRARPPEEDEIEPLSRAIWELAQSSTRSATWRRSRRCRRWPAAIVAFFAEYDCCSRPRWPSGRCRSGSATGSARTRSTRLRPLRALHALHGAVQRHRAAGDLGAGRLRRRRAADRRPARRQAARRGHAAAGRRADRDRAAAGRTARRHGRD